MPASVSSRIEVLPARELREFASDVRAGLTKSGEKELHSKYLYDQLGSALFEAITLLPEYGLTRADARLLRTHAAAIAGLDVSAVTHCDPTFRRTSTAVRQPMAR